MHTVQESFPELLPSAPLEISAPGLTEVLRWGALEDRGFCFFANLIWPAICDRVSRSFQRLADDDVAREWRTWWARCAGTVLAGARRDWHATRQDPGLEPGGYGRWLRRLADEAVLNAVAEYHRTPTKRSPDSDTLVRPLSDGIDPLDLLQRGDNAPYERFIAEEGNRLLAFFRRSVGDLQTAEDLCQETIYRTLRAVMGEGLTHQPTYFSEGKPRGFLWMIARNVLVDHKRKVARTAGQVDVEGEQPGELDVITENVDLTDFIDTFHRRLQRKLSARNFRLYQLRASNSPFEEIARELDSSISTVRRHWIRVVRPAIKEALVEIGYGDAELPGA